MISRGEPRPTEDRIKHRTEEVLEIEAMPFFRKSQRNCLISGEVGPLKLTPEEIKAKAKWIQIMDERRAMLPKKVGGFGVMFNSASRRGIQTTTSGH